MIVLNTPHNPVGKVFTRNEIEKIADIAKEFNLLVMSDEVVRILGPFFFLFRELQPHSPYSMTVWSLMVRSTCELPLFRICGKGRLQSALQGVSLVPFFSPGPFILVFNE